jgi:hypothetical protein
MERDRLGTRLDAEVHVFQQPVQPVARTRNEKRSPSVRSAYTRKAK